MAEAATGLNLGAAAGYAGVIVLSIGCAVLAVHAWVAP